MPRIRSIRNVGNENFLFPRLFSLSLCRFSAQSSRTCKLARRCRVGRETKRGSCITRSNLTQVEATRDSACTRRTGRNICIFPARVFFLANQLNYHRLYRSSLSRARFRFTFLVIMHYYYYPRAVLQFTAIQRLSREDDDNAPLPGKRLNASRVR